MKAICLPRRIRNSFSAFCSSRLTFFLKWKFWMIFFKEEAIFASSISQFGKSLNWARGVWFIHWIDHFHFFETQQSIRGQIGTNSFLNFESYLPTSKSWKCGEFLELKLRYLHSFLYNQRTVRNIHKKKESHGRRPSCKCRRWNCTAHSLFTSRDKSPCTSLHWDSTCGALIRRVKNYLIKCLSWVEHKTWIAKKRFPVSQTNFMYQVACFGDGST